MRRIIFFTAVTVALIFAATYGQSQSKTTGGDTPPILTPSRIGEFVNPATYEELEKSGEDFDETYMYRSDPNGKYYHFYSFLSDGDSQWDAYCGYEEKFTATSTLAPSKNVRYDAANLNNDRKNHGGNRAVTWCEGAEGYGIGERVNMRVRTRAVYKGNESEIRFYALMIVNGYAKNAATWKNNARVKILRLYVGDKHWCDLHLKDIIKPQIFEFPKDLQIYPAKSGKVIPEKGAFSKQAQYYPDELSGSVYQTDLSFEIVEVYPGEKYEDTCITGIALNTAGGIY